MRIGLLTNFWYLRGGLERVVFGDAQGLRDRGHVVLPFASAHHLNEPTETGGTFPASVDHGTLGEGMGVLQRGATAVRLFHNREAAAAFDRYADAYRPDLVHQHGLARQFSPSVLERARSRGIPTVLTLHDYSLRCPSGDLSRPGELECLNVSCAGHRYDRAVRFRCVHDSRAASALAAVELLAARALRRYERAVDLFLAPSEYVAQRMRESGVPAGRLRVMPNALDSPEPATGDGDDGYIFAFGRLVRVKGFSLVVELAGQMPDVRFVLAGDGPDRVALEAQTEHLPNIEFTGFKTGEALRSLIRKARAVIVPSEWPEPFGMVVLEAWREARPVIAARSGALPELVRDGQDGITFAPRDVQTAASAARRLAEDPALAARLGSAGRQRLDTEFSISTHLDRLESTYRELIGDGR